MGRYPEKIHQTFGFTNKIMGWGFDGIYLHNIYIYVICLHVYNIFIYIYIANTCQYYVTMRLRWVYQETWGRGSYLSQLLSLQMGKICPVSDGFRPMIFRPAWRLIVVSTCQSWNLRTGRWNILVAGYTNPIYIL